jgi:hypothetical protein
MENVGVIGAKRAHARKLSEIPARLRIGKQCDPRPRHHPFTGRIDRPTTRAGAVVAIAASSGAANRRRVIDMLLQTVRFQRKPDAIPSLGRAVPPA